MVGKAGARFEVHVSRCPEFEIAIGKLNGGSFSLEKRTVARKRRLKEARKKRRKGKQK